MRPIERTLRTCWRLTERCARLLWRRGLIALSFTSCVTALAFSALAGSALLDAVAPTQNTNGSPVVGPLTYRLFWGCSSPGQYQSSATIASFPHTVEALPDVGTCYFAATAIDALARESAFSNQATKFMGFEVSFPPDAPFEPPTITWTQSAPQTVVVTLSNFSAHPTSPEVDLAISAAADVQIALGSDSVFDWCASGASALGGNNDSVSAKSFTFRGPLTTRCDIDGNQAFANPIGSATVAGVTRPFVLVAGSWSVSF